MFVGKKIFNKLSMKFVTVRVKNSKYLKKKNKIKQMFAFTFHTGNFCFKLKLKPLSGLSVL